MKPEDYLKSHTTAAQTRGLTFQDILRVMKELQPPWHPYRGKYDLCPTDLIEGDQMFLAPPNDITGKGLIFANQRLFDRIRANFDAETDLIPITKDEMAAMLAYYIEHQNKE